MKWHEALAMAWMMLIGLHFANDSAAQMAYNIGYQQGRLDAYAKVIQWRNEAVFSTDAMTFPLIDFPLDLPLDSIAKPVGEFPVIFNKRFTTN